eukprot:m.199474 g.199474  ORF g.199474 m.199474 type:complete len:512 (+) comp32737_c0_seq1:255-1790(+)
MAATLVLRRFCRPYQHISNGGFNTLCAVPPTTINQQHQEKIRPRHQQFYHQQQRAWSSTFSSPIVNRQELERRLAPSSELIYTEPQAVAAIKFWRRRRDAYTKFTASTVSEMASLQSRSWSVYGLTRNWLLSDVFPFRGAMIYSIYVGAVVVGLDFFGKGSRTAGTGYAPHVTEACGPQVTQILKTTEQGIIDSTSYLLQTTEAFALPTSVLATALFLLFSFRLNRCLTRWWDGRCAMAQLHAEIKSLVAQTHVYMGRRDVAAQICFQSVAAARATEYHLRSVDPTTAARALAPLLMRDYATNNDPAPTSTAYGGDGSATFHSVGNANPVHPCAFSFEALVTSKNRPFYVTSMMSATLSEAFDKGHVKNIRALVGLQATVERINSKIATLERINCTPEPWAYQKHLRGTSLMWLTMLPLALAPWLHVFAIPVASMVAFVIFKIENMAMALQNPFGFDPSDLPICTFNDDLQEQILETLLRYSNIQDGSLLEIDQIATQEREQHSNEPPSEL